MAKRVERRESGDAKVEAKKCRHRREDDRTKPGDAKLSQQILGESKSSVNSPFLAKSECSIPHSAQFYSVPAHERTS